MEKLDATRLSALGAPHKSGAAQIEEWLRTLLRPGAIRLERGVVELRGPRPVVTTLGDLKKACGVAVETVKQGLRPLEMDHWVVLVDGAHTRLLGPPRFRLSVTKENFWGSVSQAIEVRVTDGLNPLESIDFDRLRQPAHINDRKQALTLGLMSLDWSAQVRLANGRKTTLKPGEAFTLSAGSALRESGRPAVLQEDLPAQYVAGRDIRVTQAGELVLDQGERSPLAAESLVHLERSSLIRLPKNQTGILSIRSRAHLESGETVDWSDDGYWLSRFRSGLPLVLLRRAIFAELDQVVIENCAGVGDMESDQWRVALGFHECILDATLPFRAGRCSLEDSPSYLLRVLRDLKSSDSMRQRVAAEFGFVVGAADVRLSPMMFASPYDRRLLAAIAGNPAMNSELLSLSNRIPCWCQIGAYHRRGDVWPWEITREVYFAFVDVHYRQHGTMTS